MDMYIYILHLGLADELLQSKIESEKQSEQKDEGSEKQKKTEPMPRWQKFGYLFLGLTMGGSLIANAVLFSMPDVDEQGNYIEVWSLVWEVSS